MATDWQAELRAHRAARDEYFGSDHHSPIPADERVLAAGDTLYVVGRPDLLRRIEAAAGSGGPASGGRSDGPTTRQGD